MTSRDGWRRSGEVEEPLVKGCELALAPRGCGSPPGHRLPVDANPSKRHRGDCSGSQLPGSAESTRLWSEGGGKEQEAEKMCPFVLIY